MRLGSGFRSGYRSGLAYKQLISLGVHVGHSFKNSLYESAWMVYGFRKELLIINLYKFITIFRVGFLLLNHALNRKKPVWFVNLDASFDRYTRIAAERCGEFSTTLYWIKGMVSNFRQIIKSFRKITRLNSFVKNRKDRLFYENYKRWVFTRYSWPRALFMASVETSYFAAREANSFKIPSWGIVDTTTHSQASSVAVPGNDDSLDCIVFYNNIVSEQILYKKFLSVVLWFSNIRRAQRAIKFRDWILNKTSTLKMSNWGFVPFNYNVHNTTFVNYNALKFFSSKSIWLEQVKNQLYIFRQSYSFNKEILVNEVLLKLDDLQPRIYNGFSGYKVRKTFRISRYINLVRQLRGSYRKYKQFMRKKFTKMLLRLKGYYLRYSYDRRWKKLRKLFSKKSKMFFFINHVIFFKLHRQRSSLYNFLNYYEAFNNIKQKVFLYYLISKLNLRSTQTGRIATKNQYGVNRKKFRKNYRFKTFTRTKKANIVTIAKIKRLTLAKKKKIQQFTSTNLAAGYCFSDIYMYSLGNVTQTNTKFQFQSFFFNKSRYFIKHRSFWELNSRLSEILVSLVGINSVFLHDLYAVSINSLSKETITLPNIPKNLFKQVKSNHKI